MSPFLTYRKARSFAPTNGFRISRQRLVSTHMAFQTRQIFAQHLLAESNLAPDVKGLLSDKTVRSMAKSFGMILDGHPNFKVVGILMEDLGDGINLTKDYSGLSSFRLESAHADDFDMFLKKSEKIMTKYGIKYGDPQIMLTPSGKLYWIDFDGAGMGRTLMPGDQDFVISRLRYEEILNRAKTMSDQK